MTNEAMGALREQLVSRSFLYADPGSYTAGVEEVLAAWAAADSPDVPLDHAS